MAGKKAQKENTKITIDQDFYVGSSQATATAK